MPTLSVKDLRHAARGLAHTPTVAISAIACLALGIGATAAISSALERALLAPLPFAQADRLVAVHRITPQSGPHGTWPVSVPTYLDLARRTTRIQALAALGAGSALITLKSGAVQASEYYATGNLFPMLGVQAERGRLFGPQDDRLDQPLVAVVSDRFWRNTLGANPAIVGSTLAIDGEPTTVVGIAPPDFHIPQGGDILRADIWMPIRFTPKQIAIHDNYLKLVGRLAPGATPAGAEAELRTIFDGMAAETPDLRGEGVRVAALQPENTASIRTPLLLLLGAVCMVLLIAATNVAALLLARGVQRRRELAIRSALGASAWDAMRVALAESFLVTGVGVTIGLGLAVGGVRTIGRLAARQIPQLAGTTLDGRVVLFAFGLAIVVAIGCGLVPAVRASTVDPQDALRGGRGAGAGREHHRALRLLVVGEIGLSLVLLIGASLVLKAFAGLIGNDPGFDPTHLLTVRVTMAPTRYPNQSSTSRFLDPALLAIQQVPGVAQAAAIDIVPYINWGDNSNVHYEGRPGTDPTRFPLVELRTISPTFFDVTGQRLISGRALHATDDEKPATPIVVVVNQALVDRDFNGANPVGKRFYLTDTTFGTIVGVVSNIRNAGPIAAPQPEMYWSTHQNGLGSASFSLMIRTTGSDPASVAAGVRAAIAQIDPTAAVSDVRPMPDVIAASLGSPRFYFSLIGTFAAVALVLALAGLYGVLSYAVAQRTREMGIRAALGSPRAALVRLVMGEGARLTATGVVMGLAGAALVTRLMQFMLYAVSPLDASAWAGATALLVVASLLAVAVPAVRAMRADPLIAMKAE